MTAMDIEPTAITSTHLELVVPTPRESEPAAPVELPWWLGTSVPQSALAEQARLIAQIRELERLVYETRVELTGLRQRMHDVTHRRVHP